MTQIWLRRAYKPPGPSDGQRILVDSLWSRGVSKEKLDPGRLDEGNRTLRRCATGSATIRTSGTNSASVTRRNWTRTTTLSRR